MFTTVMRVGIMKVEMFLRCSISFGAVRWVRDSFL